MMRCSLLAALVVLGGCDGARVVHPPRPRDSTAGHERAAATATPRVASVVALTSATAVAVASPPGPSVAASASPLPEPEEDPPVRRGLPEYRDRGLRGDERVALAEQTRGVVVALFAAAKVSFPPRQMLLRAFKKERRLEVWAASKASGPLGHVTTYEVCAASGELGPKRREGDGQVPEGFYRLKFFKQKSDYHLSMQVSYPNDSDKLLGDPKRPGGEIMIHGACASIGCLAITDRRIEELWLMTRSTPLPIHVHVFPTRKMSELSADKESPHHVFWQNLALGFERFEQTHVVPKVRVAGDGRYAYY